MSRSLIGACIVAGSIGWLTAAQAQTAEEFYRGKRELNLITSSAVGGGYDQYSRLVARHMTKYLPGNPTIIVQNMLGGGGIRAANYIYNVAPKDGTVYRLIDRGMPTAPLLYGEKSQARFDAVKFSWIGSLMRETGMGVLSARSVVNTIDDAKRHEIFFGTTGPETDPAMFVAAGQRTGRHQDQGHPRLQGPAGGIPVGREGRARRTVHERLVRTGPRLCARPDRPRRDAASGPDGADTATRSTPTHRRSWNW